MLLKNKDWPHNYNIQKIILSNNETIFHADTFLVFHIKFKSKEI